ncbi:MAG: YdcF family protein, partial [Acidimicrobiales bacterium]
ADPVTPRPRRRRRRRRVVLLAVAVLVAGYLTVTGVWFVAPPLGTVAHPQAVVVLGGYGNRVARGFEIALRDGAGTVAVSRPSRSWCPPGPPGVDVVCFVPDPLSTRGEARAVARLARAHHWSRLVVVAGTTQVVRARVRLERCFSGQLAFSGVDPSGVLSWAYEVFYDQAALAKALVWQYGC